jgi:hypothetical protein
MLLISFGAMLREILHQSMDLFLPLMIALLSFAPMRGVATSFVVKYVSVAMWPVAWALGNSVACSLLVSVMRWVISSGEKSLAAYNHLPMPTVFPEIGPAAAGLLPSAASGMSWGLLDVNVLTITFVAFLFIASAVAAPLALTSTLTKGTNFLGAQLKAAADLAVSSASAVAPLASPVGAMKAPSQAMFSSLMMGAARSLSGVSARVGAFSEAGGPAGTVASTASRMLARASRAVSDAVDPNPTIPQLAESGLSAEAHEAASIKETLPVPIATLGDNSRSSRRAPPTSPRFHRRH